MIPRPTRRTALLGALAWAALSPLPPHAAAQDPNFIAELDVPIPMRDGTKLAANIYRPKDGDRHPVVLMRTPYGKPDAKWGDARKYTAAGYVIIAQDCRGRGKSAGVWEPFVNEPADGFDTQEWAGTQPWSNGAVGTAGGSYVGWTQWASAASASKHLRCMMPVVPFADVYDDIAYPGGAFQLSLLMGWGVAVGGIPLKPGELEEAFKYLPIRTFGDQFEKKVPYLNEWATHTQPDAYWKQRRMQGGFEDVTVPTLNVGGWYDIFSKTTIELVDQVRARSKDRLARRNQFVIMGPWAHGVGVQKVGEVDFGAEARRDLGDIQFKWMEYWLKGRETGVEDWPPYQIFVMGENKWRAENEWPLKRTVYQPYYLHSGGKANSSRGDGTLSTVPPTGEPADQFTSDPNRPVPTKGGNNLVGAPAGPYDQSSVEERDDILVYSTAPLESDVEVTGPVKMIVHATSSAPDTDFTAKLVDVHPDGKAINLCDGIIRTRYREGIHQPKLLTPGTPVKLEIDLWVTSNLFKKGHRIRVEIAGSNFPRFDRNGHTGREVGSEKELLVAKETIHHDASHPSQLVLPVIPR